MLDKFFDDKCLYAKSGSVQRGPGLICGLYILLIITGLIYNIVISQQYLTKYGLTREQVLLQNGIDILLAIFSIVFIYHMCYICRGFVGFLVLLLINMSLGLIRAAIFSNYTKASIKMGMDRVLR
tara:strand:- start:485 stop:859 length:375 start_codon:yes stop_codon:yes gene_type:complete